MGDGNQPGVREPHLRHGGLPGRPVVCPRGPGRGDQNGHGARGDGAFPRGRHQASGLLPGTGGRLRNLRWADRFQYGSIVPGELVSYTELEFNAAGAAELHRLVFLLRDTDGMPPGLVDDDPVPVGQFRSRLRNAELTVATFASADELELKVFQALTALPRPAPRAVRYSLPPGTATFVGRDTEVDRITAAGGRGVVAIRGMPGAGKTALAVHAAHLLRNQFPDRQLF